MNKIIFIVGFLSIIGCKQYYNTSKVYFDKEEIVRKSASLLIQSPAVINFSGTVGDSIKTFEINGLLKVISLNRFQIFLFSKTFGIEIGRIEFNGEEVFYIDKFNKKYFRGNISDFKYFNGLTLSTNQYLKLILGRLIYDDLFVEIQDGYSFVYKDIDYKGSGIFNTFGFLQRHKFESNIFSIDFNFSDYYIGKDIPSRITGIINMNKSNLIVDLNYYNISNVNIKINDFIIPNNFSEIL